MIKSGVGKNAVVIGGGPGGMNTAEILSGKGFKVTLFEQGSKLGGALILASKGTGKDKIARTIEGYAARLTEAGVDVRLNSKVESADDIKKYDPSVVVVAIGGNPIKPSVSGVDLSNVKQAQDVLGDYSNIKNKDIAIIGSGMTGLETAEVLLNNGNKLRIYDMLDEIAKDAEMTNKIAIMGHLASGGVVFHPNHKMKGITSTGVILEDMQSGEEITDDADMVVLSLGVKSDNSLQTLKETFDNIIFVGDCVSPGKIVNATAGEFEKLWAI
jgi:pyruvate/2-oxoglutarate dehydrogenase complex dihydrolipoamide dehydrogenase (E3) component